MYIQRHLLTQLQQALANFPAVLITGPRQSGKTTFLRHEFAHQYQYVTFDDLTTREFAASDPKGFLGQFLDQPVIFDEIQYIPELLPYLKILIDENRATNGHWLLTGSQQFSLMKDVSESLAGRIALLELLPFNLLELDNDILLPTLIWNGGYPDPRLHPQKRNLWLSAYIQTYIERDIRLLKNVQDLRTFETFISLCAARHSQLFNQSEISRQSGMSVPTIKMWGSLLQASYIMYMLPPYFNNYGKRLIKSPKMYFLDSALVCSLTRQVSGETAIASFMAGALFEGLIISEAVKAFTIIGEKPDLYFWRSHDGLEVDLIIRLQGMFYPIEIKLTATPSLNHTVPLTKFKQLAGAETSEEGLLVCQVEKTTKLPNNNIAMPWKEFPHWLSKKLKKT